MPTIFSTSLLCANCLCCYFLLFSTTLWAQHPILRTPDLSPDGEQLSFSYQGDIWTVAASGGRAIRQTIHESYEASPAWSPDGQHIAFVGNRYGNNDIFVIQAQGSKPQRITYYSENDAEVSWLNPTELLFSSRRTFQQIEREPEIYHALLGGGTPTRFLDALGSQASVSPDGRYIAFVKGGCRLSREAYRGPANRDIWVYDQQAKTYTQITTDEGQDHSPRWTADGRLLFLSARDGRYNLYSSAPKAAATKTAITRFTDWGIRHYSSSADGQHLVIEKGAHLWHSTDGGQQFHLLEISVNDDDRFYPSEPTSLSSGLSNFAVSPNGKYIALENRGEIFVKPNDAEKKRSRNLTDHPYRDESAAWLSDSTLLFISDRPSSSATNTPAPMPALYLLEAADASQTNLYLNFAHRSREILRTPLGISDFILSPQRDQIAVVEGRGKLSVYPIAAATATLGQPIVLQDSWDRPSGISWSPDGKWLAYSLSDLAFNEEIYIHAADNSQAPVNISMHPRGDSQPLWSPDGSKLAFLSVRNKGDNDVWFVWLKTEDWEKTQRDWDEADEWASSETRETKKEAATGVKVVIDFLNIHERLVQVSSLPGNEGDIAFDAKGEYLYFSTNNGSRAGSEGKSDLLKIKWNGEDMSVFLAGLNPNRLQLAPDAKSLFYLSAGKLATTPLDKGKATAQPFEANITIHHALERQYLINDGWRALQTGFYDPAFHGRDWAALKAKYEPLMLGASTRQDFAFFYNQMLGQLNASHMGFSSPAQDEDLLQDKTGFLGIALNPQQQIQEIVPNSPADRKDSKLELGDRILAINGQRLAPTDNLYAYLNGRANERIQLTLERQGKEINILIRPTASLRALNYEAWVRQQKALTHAYSQGRLGYIHIQGMNWPSFERFERELTAAGHGKEGIVIDVRYNGGGWTTDLLMAVLNVRQHAYTVPRGASNSLNNHLDFKSSYPFGERLPLAALTLPSVALCNEASYSNAEIFSHAYQQFGLGKLVGQPTFGAVISTGSHRMMEGSTLRMPFRAWYVHATDQNMEGGPAVPDILVRNAPDSKARNEDAQLRAAVEVLLAQLRE